MLIRPKSWSWSSPTAICYLSIGEFTMTKVAYTKPELEEIGSFEEITQGASTGSALDAVFPAGTPAGRLTFS